MLALRSFRGHKSAALTRPISPTDDHHPDPPRDVDDVILATQIPAWFRADHVPESRLPIQRLLDYPLPPLADPRTITILTPSNAFSLRGPTELDRTMHTIPVPPSVYVHALRERAGRLIREGVRSITSPFNNDSRRFPLWAATYWSEIIHVLELRARYSAAREWLATTQRERFADGNLIARLLNDWRTFGWSQLHKDLQADDPTAHLPQPDRLLPILSDQWLEDDQMDLLIRLTSLNLKRQKNAPGVIVPLRFWRELEHLDMHNEGFDELHYPCLAETWALIRDGNVDLGFILNNANSYSNGDKGTHWSACVFNLSRREFRYGDSFDRSPPKTLQSRLERWLRRCNALSFNRRLTKGKDLPHAIQTDGHSCGVISINTLERYFLNYPLWTPETDADIRMSKYINLLEYNGSSRGMPLPPPQPRSRTNSASTTGSHSMRPRARSRPDKYYGDIPVEGDDLSVLRGWTPEEGAGAGSRYQVVSAPRSNRSTSRSTSGHSSRESSREKQSALEPYNKSNTNSTAQDERTDINNGTIVPDLPLIPSETTAMVPSPHTRPETITTSRPLAIKAAPTHRPAKDDVIIPSSEWERVSPSNTNGNASSDERGRRPRPIMPPSPARDSTNLPARSQEQNHNWPVALPQQGTRPSTANGVRPAGTSPQSVPFPSMPPTTGPRHNGHTRSKTEPLAVPDSRSRRTSGSSLSSIWKSVKHKMGPQTVQQQPTQSQTQLQLEPTRISQLSQPTSSRSGSSERSRAASSNEPRGRTETMGTTERRRRKSSLKSTERGPGEQRAPGLNVKFATTPAVQKDHNGKPSRNLSQLDTRREGEAMRKVRGTTPPRTLAGMKAQIRSSHQAREAIAIPPNFTLDDPSIPLNRRQEALESRYKVVIDAEPTRLVVYGSRSGVSDALRELYAMFTEFQANNSSESFVVSRRASHRIGLWAISQRLQKETNTRINVDHATATVTVAGPKNILSNARRNILSFARQIDDEKHTHFIVPSSKDLRRVLMIALPRIIGKCGGPEDEEEARQMFTITNPGDGGPVAEMVVDLWCHPSMSEALKLGLTHEVEQFMRTRMREVWAVRVPPWRVHALRNSHIFKRYDAPNHDGVAMVSLHTVEKRLSVQIAWPDQRPRPSWDMLPIVNMPSPRTSDAPDMPLTKIRGSQAQLPTAVAEIEDRMRRLLQVTLRVPGSFHRELKTSGVVKRLESLGVDALIQNPTEQHFECLLSAVRQEDLDAGQADITKMANRISKGLPAVDR